MNSLVKAMFRPRTTRRRRVSVGRLRVRDVVGVVVKEHMQKHFSFHFSLYMLYNIHIYNMIQEWSLKLFTTNGAFVLTFDATLCARFCRTCLGGCAIV